MHGIDWAIMILNLYSYYLIGCKKRIGFLLGIIGSVIGLILFSIVSIISFNVQLLLTISIINYYCLRVDLMGVEPISKNITLFKCLRCYSY